MKTFSAKNFIYESILNLKGDSAKKEYQIIKKITKSDEILSRYVNTNKEKILDYAINHVPYYRSIANHRIEEIKTIKNFPKISKKILENNLNELLSNELNKNKWYFNYSGGSTGQPTKFVQDKNYAKWFRATQKYFYENILEIDQNSSQKIFLWGSPRDINKGSIGYKAKFGNWLINTTFLNSFKMDIEQLDKKVKTINQVKPDLIQAYAGAIYELSKYISKKNIHIVSPKVILTSAETLTLQMRETIENTFGCKVHNFYGSRETASIAGECKNGLIHIFNFNNYLEILNKQGFKAKNGELGEIIVTNLHNYSMPFIRYRIGDMATMGPKKCTCGNILPTLKEIHGRTEEQFIKKDGSIVIGYYFVHLLAVERNKGYLSKFQIVQTDYEKIKIVAVKKQEMPDIERKKIDERIKTVMGKNCEITWEYVKDIPKTKSGKYLYTKSYVNN